MAQRHQLYESQKEITNEVTAILAKIESTEVRSASIAQFKKHLDILESKFISNDNILKKLGETSEDYFIKDFFQAGIKLFQLCRTAMQKYGQTSAEAVLAPKKAEDLKESLMESMESSLQKSIESVRISIKDDMMQQMGLMMQNLLQQLKPNHGENSLKELKSAPREPERAPREPESAPREPENVPREQINIPKEEKVQNHDEAGITKEEEVTSNLLIQFRREIRKLEECLSDTEAENILILEHKKSSWEKIMVDIKQIHRELVVNHSIKEDIDEELELIDKQYGDALKEILLKISAMLEDKKGLVLETIKIPIFYGDMEEWYSFHNMFNRFVHMSKLPAVEKLMRLKTHVRGEALKIIQNLPITENNYEAAWEILNQRFGNKRILFTKLVDKILDQPSTNIMSASSLRNLLNITNESIQALKARGVSSDIYSDNGTNFVGANIKLDKDFKAAVLKNETIIPILAMQKIRWHFIPPAAPHFGGIWEAGVKSVKFHLKRTIGEAKLTYEEMSTLLIQIEAVLNSRPLVALNCDEPDQLDALTPGHFLIGRPLNACPEVVEEANINSLNRWKLIQKLRKDFWVRWKEEYLTTLQQRNKWKFPLYNLKEGTIVLIKDENTHPANWPLARIAEVHSGKDGKVRVATLKLANSSLKRPISKLCPLVYTDKEEEKSAPVKSCFTTMKPEKKKLCWLQLILMMLMIMIMKPVKALPINMNNVVSITNLSTNTALYLDKVGQLNAINSKWNLVVYYDLSLYYQELERIGKLMGKVREECPKLNVFKDSCEMVMSVMERRYTLINQNNELLINKPRKKRAPFEFVGSIYHVLFGMMDAGDREQMEENMKNIFSNQEDLNKLIKQQTSLIDSTVNVLKKTTEDVNNNFKQMYGQMKLFYDQTKNESSAERLTMLFSVLATQLNLMVDECQKIQSSVINMLIDINHGHINTDLLTPSQLRKELLHIENVLPNNLVLPGKTTGTELKEVYHGMKAKGTIIDDRLVVQIEIPLIQKHNSEVYEIITLPVDVNNSAVMPRVEDEFIIYNFASNMYFLMSQAKLNKCGKSLQGQYNCIGNMPWKPAIERSCEVSALKQSRHAECAFEAVPRKSVWKQLSTENQWIFTVFDNLVLTVDCGPNNRSWVTLPPKGILKLVEGCTATYEGITLSASQHLESAVNSVIQASTWGIDLDKIEAKLVKPFDVTIINNTKDINHLMKEVLNMKETKINLKRLQFHMLSGHTSLILIIIIIFILIGLVIKNKCCTHREVVKIDFSTPLPLRARQNVQI